MLSGDTLVPSSRRGPKAYSTRLRNCERHLSLHAIAVTLDKYDAVVSVQQPFQEVRLNRYLRSWSKFDLVICDELGYLQLGAGASGPVLS